MIGPLRFRIAEDSPWFEGHFEGAPIFPGVAHIALAVMACGRDSPLTAVRDIRFSRPLGPGDEVEVVLTEGKDATSVRFEIRVRGEVASAGTFVFA